MNPRSHLRFVTASTVAVTLVVAGCVAPITIYRQGGPVTTCNPNETTRIKTTGSTPAEMRSRSEATIRSAVRARGGCGARIFDDFIVKHDDGTFEETVFQPCYCK